MKIAVIGTNFITQRLLTAAALNPDFELAAVCGSSVEKAQTFAAPYGDIPCYSDYRQLAAMEGLDGVYLGTPNQLHHSMAIFFLEAGIPVLCEKPLAVTHRQAEEMVNLSHKKNALLLEGIVPLFIPNFQAIRDTLPHIGTVRTAHLAYCQYSGRYQSYREGVVLNAFNPDCMGGSLLDIGIYPLYHALALFGKPDSVTAAAQLLSTGVDGSGTAILRYPDKNVILQYSKCTQGINPSEIQGEDGSITYAGGSNPVTAQLHIRGGELSDIVRPQHKELMYYELTEFIRCIKDGAIDSPLAPHTLALEVYAVTDEIRRQTGVRYSCD